MRLPDPATQQSEFQRRGFVVLAELLDPVERSALFADAMALVQHHAAAIDRADRGQRLSYEVVTGDSIRAAHSALFAFYTASHMLEWVRAVTAAPWLDTSTHLRSAININCMRAAGQRYRWHRDAVPYTALLFLSSLPRAAGGALLIHAADDEIVEVQPRAGDLLLMDGNRCLHAVSPLTESMLRLTVPMVYPTTHVDRPAGLDDYLYGSAAPVDEDAADR